MTFAQIAFGRQRKKKAVFVCLKTVTPVFGVLFVKRFIFSTQLVKNA